MYTWINTLAKLSNTILFYKYLLYNVLHFCYSD